MDLIVQRSAGDSQCTPGEMLIDGVHFAFTLEPRKDQSQGKPYCVDAGTYSLIVQFSQHFQRMVPCVQDVPNFTAVEVHPGNYPSDTHACCLVGFTESKDFVGQSDDAFNALMERMAGTAGNTITYLDAQPSAEG